MSVDCEVIPRANASSAELKSLGMALAQWCTRESGGILHYVNRQALADLANGEQPRPFLNQFEDRLDELNALSAKPARLSPLEQQRRQRKLREEFGATADKRLVYFQVLGGAYFDRQRTIDSLRQDIPAVLVADILIGDKSWDQAR